MRAKLCFHQHPQRKRENTHKKTLNMSFTTWNCRKLFLTNFTSPPQAFIHIHNFLNFSPSHKKDENHLTQMENLIFYNSSCFWLDNFVSVIKECNFHVIPFCVCGCALWVEEGQHQQWKVFGKIHISFSGKSFGFCKISKHA